MESQQDFKTVDYAPLLSESEKDSQDEALRVPYNRQKERNLRSRWRHWSVKLLLFTAYSLFLIAATDLWISLRLNNPFQTYTPAREAIHFQQHDFDGSLGRHTKYTGEPRPEVEAAWSRIFKNYNIRFTQEELRKLNRTALELQNGGGHYGQLSAYHHLHCLKMLRQLVWHDLYNVSITAMRGHADHCIEDIRNALMCQPDLSVVTFYWHPEMRKPKPNFHLDQSCVDWDRLDAWAAKRSFSIFDQKTLVHPKLGLSFPMVDGEIQVHESHDHTKGLAPVWPEEAD